MLNRRRCLRYPVHFRSIVSTQELPESHGTTRDLSLRGCRIHSDVGVVLGVRVRVTIDLAEPDAAIVIEQAVVHWAHGQEFGVEFVTITPEHFERLTKLVQGLPQVSNRG